MLQSISDRSQGWLAGTIIALVCITFAFWGVHSYLDSSGASGDVVAKVNGESLHEADLNTAYQRLRQQQQMQLGSAFVIDQKMETELKRQALNQMVITHVLMQAAAKEGYRVTSDEVGAALLSIPMFQVDGRFSRDRFNEVLNNILYTENTFLADLQTTMLINQVRSGIIDSAFSLPNDIAAAIKLINQKRDLAYLVIPAQRFLNGAQISDAQALDYYNQHKTEFTTPEQVSVEYLELSLPQLAAQLNFTDAQLMQFYQNNLNNYTSPQRWHVAHILIRLPENALPQQVVAAQARIDALAQRLKAGESFAKLAQAYSDDPSSAKNGGVLDWFSPGMIDSAFEKTVSGLKQIGDVSAPVRTKYGFSIIKLIDQQAPQVQPFAKVRDQVQKALAQQQAEQTFADKSDKLTNLTYANPNSLDVAAKALGLSVQTTSLFSRQGGKDQITANPKVVDAAFSSDVVQGNNSDAISLDPDTVLVLRAKQHVPGSLQPFATVKDQIVQQLKTIAAQQQAQTVGQQLLQKMQQGATTADIAQQANAAWQTVNNAGRFDSRLPGAVLNAAFRTQRPGSDNKPTSNGFKLPNGDYALLSLTAVHDGTLGCNAAAQERIYREELENGFGQLDYALYVKSALAKAKIDIKNNKWVEGASNLATGSSDSPDTGS